jgi:hypothetical protein
MYPKFRITTLFWLMAIVAAYFTGRRSDQIESAANQWWRVTCVRWGGEVANSEVVMWPRRGVTINESCEINNVSTLDPEVCTVRKTCGKQLEVSPVTDGKTLIYFDDSDGNKHKFLLSVTNGRIDADWQLTGPPTRPANDGK